MLPISLAIGAGALLTGSLTCEPLAAPGRLRCSLTAALPSETLRIDWVDAVVLHVPPFLQSLRSRLSPRDAEVQKERLVRWSLALVAKTEGQGDLVLRVRAVTCDTEKRCAPTSLDVPVRVYVGPPPAPAP